MKNRCIVEELPSIIEVQEAHFKCLKKSCSLEVATKILQDFSKEREDCRKYNLWPKYDSELHTNIDNIDCYILCIRTKQKTKEYIDAIRSLTDERDLRLCSLGGYFDPHKRELLDYFDGSKCHDSFLDGQTSCHDVVKLVANNLASNFPKRYNSEFISGFLEDRMEALYKWFYGINGDGERIMRTLFVIASEFESYCGRRLQLKVGITE